MTRFGLLPSILLVILLMSGPLPTTQSAIIIDETDNDVDPSDINQWNSETNGYVGQTSRGALEVNGDSDLYSCCGYIGYGSGSVGKVRVEGTGSTWNCSEDLFVGYSGSGTLDICGGGAVENCNGKVIRGTVSVDGANSTWTNSGELRLFSDGNLHVTGGAIVSSASGQLSQYWGGLGAVTVDGPGSKWINTGTLNVGETYGAGTLSITNRAIVSSSGCSIAHGSNSSGVVTIDGIDSEWINSGELRVGDSGVGRFQITGGAVVSNTSSTVGRNMTGSGIVTVDGAGSQWNNSSSVNIGALSGRGILHISGGAVVTASGLAVDGYHGSMLSIDVGRGSSLNLGTGKIRNNNEVRVLAGAAVLDENTYSPITAGSWEGKSSSEYLAIGGTWDNDNHRFTVSAVQEGTSDSEVAIDVAQIQRLLISDDTTGWSVGASFLAADDSSDLICTAMPIDGTTLADLIPLLDDGESVRNAWTFTIEGDGYHSNDPAYLSFDVGGGLARSDMNVWHYSNSKWTAYHADDLTYDGQYASFTVTSFSGYAVSAVPEPGTLFLLIAAGLGLACYARWRRSWPQSHTSPLSIESASRTHHARE